MAYGMLLNVMWQPGWEGSLAENDTYICMTETLCCSLEIITTLFISYTSKQNKKVFVCLFFLIVLERTAWKERSRTKLSGKTTHGRGKEEAPHKRVLGAAETYFCPGCRQVHWPSRNSLKLLLNFTLNLATIWYYPAVFFFPFSLSLCYKNFNSLTLTEPQGQGQKEKVL